MSIIRLIKDSGDNMTEYTPLPLWIWQKDDWPQFRWDSQRLQAYLADANKNLGILLGRMGDVDVTAYGESGLDVLLQNIVTSSAIEGEMLNVDSMRSSLAKRLGISSVAPIPISSKTEGLAELMLDAIQNCNQPLSLTRLFQWHRWLFPDDQPRLVSLRVGQLRGDESMQVISGRMDKPRVHFEAPPKNVLEKQLTEFTVWFNQSHHNMDPLIRAALVHLWFVTLHPFDDGNGRITRALTDMVLAQADAKSIRLFSMSASILDKRNDYYLILEQSQRGDLDITPWIIWFLETLDTSLKKARAIIDSTLHKKRFWQQFAEENFLPEQRKLLNRLLDAGEKGFSNGINASQYQQLAKISKATATRHLADLVEKGCLKKMTAGGRNTRYQLQDII
jgi:Fic family protein